MVFQATSKANKLQTNSSMATAPVKSQPLHNFSLPFLKWGKNPMNNHRCRKLVDSSRESPSLDHRSSASEAESDDVSQKEPESKNQKDRIGCRSSRNRVSFSNCSSTSLAVKQQKNPTESETVVEETRPNLLIRIRTGVKDESASKKKPVVAATDEGGEGGEVEESASKPWNLRPRRGVTKASNEIGGASRNGELQENQPKSLRLRSFAEAQNVEKKEKQKFCISLSRGEIEEDFFLLTGSKPPRRPKKRAKNIQKQVDNAFPGLWLAGITADSYTIPDVPLKR